jgi:hypothetical protein
MEKIESIVEDGINYKVTTSPIGNRFWTVDGKEHRIGGPAVERKDGKYFWFLNDICYSYEEYIKEIYKLFGVGQVMLLRVKYG